MRDIRLLSAFRGNAGFSIVEVLVALAILVIGILGVVPMLVFNVKANTAGKNYGFANYLAQEKLERIRSWPLYESYDTTKGITVDNALLFGTDYVWNENKTRQFMRVVDLVRNGYGPYDCDGILFDSGTYSEGNISGGGSMNTGDVGEKCSGGYRGEDFKVIRARVMWDDNFGHHEIARHMYLAQF